MRPPAVVLALLACALTACGQKGPLYLPDPAGAIVTRPAQLPPEPSTAPNSSPTVDTPPAGDTPAPEVTAPADADTKDGKDKKNDPGKNQNGAAVPR
jgi:predicted small lipoprotein YifL